MIYNTSLPVYACRIVLSWWLHNHTIRLLQSPSISELTCNCPVAASCGTPGLSCSFSVQCAPLAPFVFSGRRTRTRSLPQDKSMSVLKSKDSA